MTKLARIAATRIAIAVQPTKCLCASLSSGGSRSETRRINKRQQIATVAKRRKGFV
jgi:hypothetical protein